MYIIMHGDKSGRLYSTQQSIGIKPINLLKQLHKKFPSEKEFYVCCCYSNYCFPNGVVEYNGVTLAPMVWSNYPVSHLEIYNGVITSCIMQEWNLPYPKEETEEEIILIKEWCQQHNIRFKELITVDKVEEIDGYSFFHNDFLTGNEIKLCNNLHVDYEEVVESVSGVEAVDWIKSAFQIYFPNYKMHFYRKGNIIYPHYLSK